MNEKMEVELKKEDRELLKSVIEANKPQQTITNEPGSKSHKTLADQMLCPDCNPPEEYKKAHLKLMGEKECKECGNIDREKEEWCSDCGEEYRKAE